MFGAEAFPKMATGTDLVPVTSGSLATTGGSAVQSMSPMDSIREMFIDMRDSLQAIAVNTLETNELLRTAVLGTPAEQREESIERGETDTVPEPTEDSGPSFLDRLKSLNPFQGGVSTFGKVLLALGALLGLKMFGPQIQGGLASLLTAIADGNLGEKIKEITELIKTRIVGAIENLKTGTESFLENIQYISDFIGSMAKSVNEYFMQFDTQGAGPTGRYADGRLDAQEMKALTDDITTKLSESIFGFTDGIVGTIVKGLTIYSVGSFALRSLMSSAAIGTKFLSVGGIFSVAALAVVIGAGVLKLADNVTTAYEDAITDELGRQQDFSYSEFFTRLLVGKETGNKIADVINNAYDKMLIGAGTGGLIGAVSGAGFFSLPGAALGAIIGGLSGIVIGALSAYFGDEAVKQAGEDLKKGFEEGPVGILIDGIIRMYNELLLKPFEFIFGKFGVEGDSLFMQGLQRMGFQIDREGPMTKQDLYPDAFNLENKTTEELLAQKNAAMAELSKQPKTKPIPFFNPEGSYFDTHTVRDLELQIDSIDKILENRTDVPNSSLPFLQMGKIEPMLEPLMKENSTLKEQLARDKLTKDLDNLIVGSGNTNTTNLSNINSFPGGFNASNDFITAVIMGDKKAKMS